MHYVKSLVSSVATIAIVLCSSYMVNFPLGERSLKCGSEMSDVAMILSGIGYTVMCHISKSIGSTLLFIKTSVFAIQSVTTHPSELCLV